MEPNEEVHPQESLDPDGVHRLAAAVIWDAIHAIKRGWVGEPDLDLLEDQTVEVQQAFLFLFVEGLRGTANPQAIHQLCHMDFLFEVDQPKALNGLLTGNLAMKPKNLDQSKTQWRSSRGLPSYKEEKVVRKKYHMTMVSKSRPEGMTMVSGPKEDPQR